MRYVLFMLAIIALVPACKQQESKPDAAAEGSDVAGSDVEGSDAADVAAAATPTDPTATAQ